MSDVTTNLKDGRAGPGPGQDPDEETQRYLELVRTVNEQWDGSQAQPGEAESVSRQVLDAVMAAVRADTRHGAQVQVPATKAGPYTVSELSLRTLVRKSVDSVSGARALRSYFDYAPTTGRQRAYGKPVRVHCRVSAGNRVGSLPKLADQVRKSVRRCMFENLGLRPDVDVHIEDLHDEPS